MHNLVKRVTVLIISCLLMNCLVFRIEAVEEKVQLSDNLVEIVDPYIIERRWGYEIRQQENLKRIIGTHLFNALEKRITEASQEKRSRLKRNAVFQFILRY